MRKRAKIIATVGPASNTKQKLTELIEAGADVFRLNFSHGTHEDHQKVIDQINEINDENDYNICILQDLQGPKIRIGQVENDGVEIVPGQELTISIDDIIGNKNKVSTTYKSLPNDVKPGDMILIDDGKLQVKVLDTLSNEVLTEVIYGGILKSRKGINLPDTKISAPSLTEKDKKDLEFGLKNDVEWVALSFVRNAKDIIELRQIIDAHGKDTKIVAKIEKPEALLEIDEIIKATDAIMVARGDLGVEIVMEDVPMVQKRITNKCNRLGKPVIIATQMLESMIDNPRPTRAEINDVANAILDGADTVMLSAESAAGKYPIESVTVMSNTIKSVEESASVIFNKYWEVADADTMINDKLLNSACRLSQAVNAKVIVGMTKSGTTGFSLAKIRPEASIVLITNNRRILRTMNLVWGVRGYYYDKMNSIDETFTDVSSILKEEGILEKGDAYIGTSSMPLHWTGRTNMMKLNLVE